MQGHFSRHSMKGLNVCIENCTFLSQPVDFSQEWFYHICSRHVSDLLQQCYVISSHNLRIQKSNDVCMKRPGMEGDQCQNHTTAFHLKRRSQYVHLGTQLFGGYIPVFIWYTNFLIWVPSFHLGTQVPFSQVFIWVQTYFFWGIPFSFGYTYLVHGASAGPLQTYMYMHLAIRSFLHSLPL